MIKTYSQEYQIKDLILNSNSVAYCSEIKTIAPAAVLSPDNFSSAEHSSPGYSPDLFPYISLFVSSMWNMNDDVFLKEYVYNARMSPKDHPCNLNHDQDVIIGHITDVWMVDADYKIIPDSTPVQNLPDLIHLVNSSVLYTAWKDQEKEKMVQGIIAEILNGNKYVSMECTFYDFDYALKDKETYEESIVVRNEETAFLTKHLRAYGGSGMFGKYKIGRILKDFTFIGKGIVDKPANPYSVIFNKGEEMSPFVAASSVDFKKILQESGVSINVTQNITENLLMSETQVENQENVVDQVVETEVVATCKCSEKDAQIAELQASLDSLKTEFEAAKAQLEAVNAKVSETQALVETEKTAASAALTVSTEREQAIADLNKKIEDLSRTIAEKDTMHLHYVRANELVMAGVPENEVKTLVANFGNSSEDAWVELKKFATKNSNVSTAGVLLDQNKVDANLSLDHSETEDGLVKAIAAALKN